MKKKFKMENLDCANCAAKMEAAINKIPGVKSATVAFMTQKLVIESDEEDLTEILTQAQLCCQAVDEEAKLIF